MGKHGCRATVTKRSDCYAWLLNLKNKGIIKFQLRTLPANLQDKAMIHKAAAYNLIKPIKIDEHGRKTWELNIFEISKIGNS